jgi:hypothetical protein
MMNCPAVTFKSVFLNTSSHGAVDFFFSPKILAVQIEADYFRRGQEAGFALAPPPLKAPFNAPMSFLAWVQMWLRLVLGIDARERPCRRVKGRFDVPKILPQEAQAKRLRRPAAHNLEALMRFAPDRAGQGLTLNQYRERFSRLSVLGRVRLYRVLARVGLTKASLAKRLNLRALGLSLFRFQSPKGLGLMANCQARLHPD